MNSSRTGFPQSGPVLDGPAPAGHTVVGELGRGRLGRALLCREDARERQVVIKILLVRPRDERARHTLETELQAAAAASRHGFAVPIESVWLDERAGFCLRQRHCPGGTAQEVLDSSGPLRPDDVVVLGIRVTAALAHSHKQGVLHLDVRPANLFRDAAGQWSLADGGLTRAIARAETRAGVLFDTRYASRELFGWEEPGPACDVYALGATLYTLLVGEPAAAQAFQEGDAAVYATALGPGAVPAGPNIAPALAALIGRMTAADPAARPPLTEVDRLLRTCVSPAVAARVPAAESASRPLAVPLPAPQIGGLAPELNAAEVHRRRRLRLTVVGGAITVVFLASAITVMATSGEDGDKGPNIVATASAGVLVPALTGVERDRHLVRAINYGWTEGATRIVHPDTRELAAPRARQLTWAAPLGDRVSGYLVVATDGPAGKVIGRQFSPTDQRAVVFVAPPVNEQTCYQIDTIVDGQAGVRVAQTNVICPGEEAEPAEQAPAAPVPAKKVQPAKKAQGEEKTQKAEKKPVDR